MVYLTLINVPTSGPCHTDAHKTAPSSNILQEAKWLCPDSELYGCFTCHTVYMSEMLALYADCALYVILHECSVLVCVHLCTHYTHMYVYMHIYTYTDYA
jgi:hypothetical protein